MSRNFNPSCAAFYRAVPSSLPTLIRGFLLFMGGLAVTVLAPSGTAQRASPQRTPRAASASPTAQSDATAVVLAQEQQAPIPRPPLTMDARLPGQPKVSYDGGQLTIIVENSTVSEVLTAVRESTGADIELPPSAADQRVWAHLGPGPARGVLAELLSSTGLDYVIQASDSDSQGIQRVLVTLRNKAKTVGAIDRSETWAAQRGASRRYPQPNPSGAEAQGQENSVSPEPANPGEAAPADPQAAPTVPASPTTRESAPAQSLGRTTEQMIQELKNMYEQRKQMQQSRTPPGQTRR